jgi:2-alkyl-3-oxoalkanoate reductase
MVHNIRHAPRIARLPVVLCRGNLRDRDSLRACLGNASIVIHCALGDWHDIALETRNILAEAKSAGIERFIHISTTAIYGFRPTPDCNTEEAALRTTGHEYCDNKMRAEKIVWRFHRRGLPAVILRPSIVYGPFATWSTELLNKLRTGRTALIDEGKGACNTTYVDNLVDAVFLALERDQALGEAFFITDGERVTWGEFIRAHLEMMDPRPALTEITAEEAATYWQNQPGYWAKSIRQARRVLVGAELRQLLKTVPVCETALTWLWRRYQDVDVELKDRLRDRLAGVNGARSADHKAFIPDPVTLQIQTHDVFFRIDKARRLLAYEPRVSFGQGIRLIEKWLHFANYLP